MIISFNECSVDSMVLWKIDEENERKVLCMLELVLGRSIELLVFLLGCVVYF